VSPIADLVLPTVMRDEGFRAKPYRDARGVLTAGYGTNLEEGLDADEAMFLLEHRLALRVSECFVFEWFPRLDKVRQGVVVMLAYQLGFAGLLGFRKMLDALARGDYQAAHDELLDSKLAREDAPARTHRHATRLLKGVW